MRISTLLLLISFYTAAQANNEVRTTDKITAATIFLRGAQVFSTAQAQVDAGINDIVIAGIPTDINEQSIQVMGYGNFTVLSVSSRKNFLNATEYPRPEIKQLKDSIESLMAQLEEDQSKKFAYDQEESVVTVNKSIGGANNGVIVADLEDAANFVRNRLIEIRAKMQAVNKRIRSNQEKLARLNNQLNQANNLAGLTQTEIVVTVSASAKGLIGMELNYVINNAGWEPSYDIKSKGTTNPLELNYKAKVYQNTGIKWDNIKLTLSSGDPNNNGIKPEIEPWRLNFMEPMPIQSQYLRKDNRAYTDKMATSEVDAAVMESAPAMGMASYTDVARKEFSENFEINIPYSVETGGRPAYVDLKSYTIPAVYQQATVPKIEESAYIVALMYDWEKLSLVPAEANVFFEGAYVGQTYLNTQVSTDTLTISLGRDKGIIVKREQLQDLNAEKYIGGSRKATYTYKITLRNTKTTPVNIVVEDQLPLVEQSSIEVKALDLQNANYDPVSGKLKWNLSIPSGSAKSVQFSFEVKYPKDKVISGL